MQIDGELHQLHGRPTSGIQTSNSAASSASRRILCISNAAFSGDRWRALLGAGRHAEGRGWPRHGTERGPAHSDGRREYESREVRGDDRNVDATRYRGDQKTYPILAGAHKAERGARYCSAHGVSQYTLIYIAMRLVVNSCVARNADIGGRTTLSPSPEAAESARRTQRRCLFALRASN